MMKQKTHASLFSGIGAAELAAEWMGWRNMFHVEIQPFPRKVLEYWYPNSKSYEDITKTDFTEWRGKIDVLTGGFPCQPFSLAGQRHGAEDDRYLWPEMLRAVREIQPAWVVGENVVGLLSMVQSGEEVEVGSSGDIFEENYIYRKEQRYTLDEICEGLEREGYSVQTFVVPACAVGAPHRRDRVWIVARLAADADSVRRRERADEQVAVTGCERTAYHSPCCENGAAADAVRTGRQELDAAAEPVRENLAGRHAVTERPDGFFRLQGAADNAGRSGRDEGEFHDGKSEKTQQGWSGTQQPVGTDCPQDRWRHFPTFEPAVRSGDDGLPGRLSGITFPKWRNETIKALGNAWVPEVAYEIFRAIEITENQE